MWNANKPSKKMPSHKPLPKLTAHNPDYGVTPTHSRPYSTQDASPPLSYTGRETVGKNKIPSRNFENLEVKKNNKVMNTYQENFNALPTVSFLNSCFHV